MRSSSAEIHLGGSAFVLTKDERHFHQVMGYYDIRIEQTKLQQQTDEG